MSISVQNNNLVEWRDFLKGAHELKIRLFFHENRKIFVKDTFDKIGAMYAEGYRLARVGEFLQLLKVVVYKNKSQVQMVEEINTLVTTLKESLWACNVNSGLEQWERVLQEISVDEDDAAKRWTLYVKHHHCMAVFCYDLIKKGAEGFREAKIDELFDWVWSVMQKRLTDEGTFARVNECMERMRIQEERKEYQGTLGQRWSNYWYAGKGWSSDYGLLAEYTLAEFEESKRVFSRLHDEGITASEELSCRKIMNKLTPTQLYHWSGSKKDLFSLNGKKSIIRTVCFIHETTGYYQEKMQAVVKALVRREDFKRHIENLSWKRNVEALRSVMNDLPLEQELRRRVFKNVRWIVGDKNAEKFYAEFTRRYHRDLPRFCQEDLFGLYELEYFRPMTLKEGKLISPLEREIDHLKKLSAEVIWAIVEGYLKGREEQVEIKKTRDLGIVERMNKNEEFMKKWGYTKGDSKTKF